MVSFAEETAAEYQFTRADQDAFAIASLERAQQAQKSGAFDREIAPVEVATRKGITTIALDEQPAKVDAAKIPTLRPAFAKDGTITAANARSEEHKSELQSLMRRSYAVFCLQKKKQHSATRPKNT